MGNTGHHHSSADNTDFNEFILQNTLFLQTDIKLCVNSSSASFPVAIVG